MTIARIQPFCKNYNINIGCFNGKEVYPKDIAERNKALCIHKNHFCLIWKSETISSSKPKRVYAKL